MIKGVEMSTGMKFYVVDQDDVQISERRPTATGAWANACSKRGVTKKQAAYIIELKRQGCRLMVDAARPYPWSAKEKDRNLHVRIGADDAADLAALMDDKTRKGCKTSRSEIVRGLISAAVRKLENGNEGGETDGAECAA